MERRLTTIVAADIAEFSRLTGLDEEGTLVAQRGHREALIDPVVNRHGGRIANTAGDSLLIEFKSAVEAIRCSVAWQDGMAARNANVPAHQRIEYRIGVNVGDVVADGIDLLGDGVNIAARLEALASPGGVILSGTVRDQIHGKFDIELADLGDVQVKNIQRPIRAFQIMKDGQAHIPLRGVKTGKKRAVYATAAFLAAVMVGVVLWQSILTKERLSVSQPLQAEEMALPLPSGPSIAVLPFDSIGSDQDNILLGDGIASDITDDLTRFNELTVIASDSTAYFAGEKGSIRDAAKELGIQYVLHGEVQKEGDRLRISAKLVNAISGEQVWAERYENDWTHIFDVRDEIAGSIVSLIGSYESPLVSATLADAKRKQTASLTAYELVVLARSHRHRFNKEDNDKSHELLNRAIALDPVYARAHVGLAWTHAQDIWNGWTASFETSANGALEAAKRAIEIDENFADAHWVIGDIYLYILGEPEKGIASLRRALALNPNHPDILADWGGNALPMFLGQADEGVELIKKARRLSPRHADWYDSSLMVAYFFAKRPKDAVATFFTVDYPNTWHRVLLAASYGHLGQKRKADKTMATIIEEVPGFKLREFMVSTGTEPTKMDQEALSYLVDGATKAGLLE